MQVRKVAVVATGALATAAAIGSTPAFAADSAGTPEVAPATVGVLDFEGTQQASDEAMRELAEYWMTVTPEQAWSAPWEQEPPQILSIGSGSAFSLAPWQICGSSAVAGVGLTIPVASPNTVLGDCVNGNIDIAGGDGDGALFSILDNSAISALSWQPCGSTVVAGVGGTIPLASPNTVTGDCVNGNIKIGTPEDEDEPDYPPPHKPIKKKPGKPDGERPYKKNHAKPDGEYPYKKNHAKPDGEYPYHKYEPVEAEAEVAEPEQVVASSAPWEQQPPQILSAGSGSAASVASWQVCGSNAVAGVGGVVPVASPNTVLGDCDNGNIDIHGQQSDALFSLLDGSALSVAPWQICGSTAVAGVGGAVPIASPNTVAGNCTNGNIKIS